MVLRLMGEVSITIMYERERQVPGDVVPTRVDPVKRVAIFCYDLYVHLCYVWHTRIYTTVTMWTLLYSVSVYDTTLST